MTDIVERLRKQAWQRSGAPKMDAGHTKMLEWEAAAEIERLLRACKDKTELLTYAYRDLAAARAALSSHKQGERRE